MDACAVCHGGMGLRQAAFTSECSHTFHLHCVSGAAVCPVCAARWREAPPDMTPAPAPPASSFSFGVPPVQQQPARMSVFGARPAAANPFVQTTCDVCRGVVGRGQPIVTSECYHTFHLRCFSGSLCPACYAPWRDMVAERLVFDDDEPVEPPAHGAAPLDGRNVVQEAASNGLLVLKTHCELPAVAMGTPRDNFAVLVHAKAPGGAAASDATTRAPLDLVTVLDVSGSMTGAKLALLKKAMGFVIDKLGPADRLSIVSFSCDARRIIRLTRMSDGGKAKAKSAVESLVANGGTNILKGLLEAAKVLDGRRYRNAVASVILLSDGQDTYNLGFGGWGSCGTKNYIDLVPPSMVSGAGNRSTPIHTFGFGTDHDAAAMHTIAEATGGTFSFIENQAVVQDSFAQCIGGLLSVAAQEAWIAVTCLHPGVRVRVVKSGRYKSRIEAYGRAASVDVGELYADEERRFLLFIDVPSAGAADDVTRLIKVSCTYLDTATGQPMEVAGEDAVVQRPLEVIGQEPSMEVERERFRVEATEDIAAARAAAERGEHAEAARILDRRQEALQRSAPGLAGDARCAALVSELRELSARVADRREYEQTGRACFLACASSHAQQRASSLQVYGACAAPRYSLTAQGCAPAAGYGGSSALFGAAGAYATPAMQMMVESSRKTREQQPPPPPPRSGSSFATAPTTTTAKSGSIFDRKN